MLPRIRWLVDYVSSSIIAYTPKMKVIVEENQIIHYYKIQLKNTNDAPIDISNDN